MNRRRFLGTAGAVGACALAPQAQGRPLRYADMHTPVRSRTEELLELIKKESAKYNIGFQPI